MSTYCLFQTRPRAGCRHWSIRRFVGWMKHETCSSAVSNQYRHQSMLISSYHLAHLDHTFLMNLNQFLESFPLFNKLLKSIGTSTKNHRCTASVLFLGRSNLIDLTNDRNAAQLHLSMKPLRQIFCIDPETFRCFPWAT